MSTFFLFYKKGTSLVELIAVIVIMGIIAGIAVPVTIAVINRQKKNAAVKSAEAVVSTMKQLLSEAQAYATADPVTLTVKYGETGATTAVTAPTSVALTGSSMSVSAADVAVDNLNLLCVSGISISLSAAGVYTATAVTVTSNGQSVSISTDCKCAIGS